MPTRYDVSQVPLQGGYIAKQCPVRAQNDVLLPTEEAPVSPSLQRRFDRGIAFEAELVSQLLTMHPDAVTIAGSQQEAEDATHAAMDARAPLILSARLPTDHEHRRVGKPDLLIHDGDGRYLPVDIKHHSTDAPDIPARIAPLQDPRAQAATKARKHKDDLLQLAHYRRMLEASGHHAPDRNVGGIIGSERHITWYDLDAPIWQTPSSTGKRKARTTMEIYDFEFEFRLDIMAVAQQGERLLVTPFRTGECAECPWRDHCLPQLVEQDHISLVPGVTWGQGLVHAARGTTDRASLAALDHTTAALIDAGVNVEDLIPIARALPPEAALDRIPPLARRKAQAATLLKAGITTAAQIAALDDRTAAYSTGGMKGLAEQIDRARAALGADPVYRRRGVTTVVVPRADVEVDVDMENVEDGVYLWGALLDGRYRPFVTWSLTPASETSVFASFWAWLMEVRAAAAEAGKTFKAYCWHEQAENTQLRRLGGAQVEEFIASDEWVDLRKVFDGQLITGEGSGLKKVARVAGFSWGVEDPGGGESMVRYDVATGDAGEQGVGEAREWVLEYNRGDVEATKAVREWMAGWGGKGIEEGLFKSPLPD